MLKISHRGNTSGRCPESENTPEYIQNALLRGYDVEVDLWVIEGCCYLGHDKPMHKVNYEFFKSPRIWVHCKNKEAILAAQTHSLHFFCHENDAYAMTSRGIVISHVNSEPIPGCVAVILDDDFQRIQNIRVAGVLTDYPDRLP